MYYCQALQGINSCRVPIYYTWVERDNYVQNALPKGIRTEGDSNPQPLITSREHEPLHHSLLCVLLKIIVHTSVSNQPILCLRFSVCVGGGGGGGRRIERVREILIPPWRGSRQNQDYYKEEAQQSGALGVGG